MCVLVQPITEFIFVSREPFDVVRDGLESFRTTGCASAGLGILFEEGLHFVQLCFCGEGFRDVRYELAEISIVQCISVYQELPVRAYPVPHQRRTDRILGDCG